MSSLPHPAQNRTARQLHAEGVAHLQNGDLERARLLLEEALALDPTAADTYYHLGNCHRRMGRIDTAETALMAAVERDPNLVPARFSLAFMYAENGRRQDAANILTRLVKYASGNLDVQHRAGGLMGDLGLYKEAADVYSRIVELEPQARNHLRLGQFHHKMGRYDEATRHLLQAIQLNPDAGAAYLLLANTHRFGGDSADKLLLERFSLALNQPGLSPATQACLNFALGKIHDDLDDYDRAFDFIKRGNQLRGESLHFAAAAWRDAASDMERLQSRDIAAHRPEVTSTAPVFVVGMLRSGTTLMERTLASHPQVQGLGEMPWLPVLVEQAVARSGLSYLDWFRSLHESAIVELRQEYMRRWPKDASARTTYMVDKNPINFMYLGLVARVFPEAKVIHCRRDPRDVGLSIYFQNFANLDNVYAYDLADIAEFHNGYARIMRHWERILPPAMLHSVEYESMVTDHERQVRALLEFLGLPWDAACLDFHTQAGDISTASVWQARQPLYARSIGRWRHYEPHLGPLLQNLAP